MKIIIFERQNKKISRFYSVKNHDDENLMILAKQITPKGLPFWIVDESEIPTDRTNREAWELDGSQGEPDGYGEKI